MTLRRLRQDAPLLLLLAALPVLAYAPAWWEGRLLGPGDGAALHFPLRAAVWEAYRGGNLPSWNSTAFLGTPLLAAYRPGAFHPLMPVLAALPDFAAFQTLVLVSLALSASLTFLYLRRLGAERVGSFVGGLSFSLGPYLAGHLGDTATVVAAPMLPLLLMATESHMNRGTVGRAAGVSIALALLLLAGSPEAARAGGALLMGRLLVGHLWLPAPRGPRPGQSALAVAAGLLLAAPQLLPTLLLAGEAGPSATGLAPAGQPRLPGAFGLVLRYTSHTPVAALALAALPLTLRYPPVRVLGTALAICLVLQWGRGPLGAPGALSLVFDFTLCVLGGLALSAQWRLRREAQGQRLRAYFLVAAIASALAQSVAAAALVPLPQILAGPVGVLALSLILYFSLAPSPSTVRAGLWLLPLTVSFLLQPHGRAVWEGAPRRDDVYRGTSTREVVERTLGQLRGERVLSLVREWPREQATELAYGNLAGLVGRRSANGYEPLTPQRNRQALSVGAGGDLAAAFFRTDPARLVLLGIRWVQLPASALQAGGAGDPLDLKLEEGRKRVFPLPMGPATEVRIVSMLADAVAVPDGTPVAEVSVRLASGRSFPFTLRAGEHTGEWAWERADVRARVAHSLPSIAESWPGTGGGFAGHRYLATLRLPGRYNVDGIAIERVHGGAGQLVLRRVGYHDILTGRSAVVSLPAAYVSDTSLLREAVATPGLRLYEVHGAGAARMVSGVHDRGGAEAVLEALAAPTRHGVDIRRHALADAGDLRGFAIPENGRAGPADIGLSRGGRVDIRAQGPGLLVASEAWDRGWAAEVDGTRAPILRVNHVQMAVALGPGLHRVVFRHHVRGLALGTGLALLAAAGLVTLIRRGGRSRARRAP